jgi:hypothetical protein
MKKILIGAIRFYQKALSPDHSEWGRRRFPYGYCRFYPSCSEYTKQSIKKHGTLAGAAKGALRILRCNPFSSGGIDHV